MRKHYISFYLSFDKAVNQFLKGMKAINGTKI